MDGAVFLTRVTIQNYRSIAACQVQLGPLMFLVGPNGSGKSNFLDALRFVSDALRTSLDHAIRDRGGIQEVRRRSSGHPNSFGIRFEFRLHNGDLGVYSFRIAAKTRGSYEVQKEECLIYGDVSDSPKSFYRVESGNVINSSRAESLPIAVSDRLYLVNAASLLLQFPLAARAGILSLVRAWLGFQQVLRPVRSEHVGQPSEPKGN